MDVVVTVPMRAWPEWLEEGCLPAADGGDSPSPYVAFHFWLGGPLPDVVPGDRVYIVAHGRLRGYAPLVRLERRCKLAPSRWCLLRQGGAEAVTIDEPIRGFQGWRYRWWERDQERPFTDWQTAGIPEDVPAVQARFA